MDLSPAEMALIELLRSMGSEPLHLAFDCTGSGVAFSLVSEGTGPVAGWGPTVEDAMSNACAVPVTEPQPAPPSRFKIIAGTDRRGPAPRGFSDSTGGYVGYSQDVYQEFLALRDTRQPLDVSTGERFYQNMLFGEIAVVTDPSSEYALMVTARLQQIIISSTSGGSGTDASNQANPSETAPTDDMGHKSLGPAIDPAGATAARIAGYTLP